WPERGRRRTSPRAGPPRTRQPRARPHDQRRRTSPAPRAPESRRYEPRTLLRARRASSRRADPRHACLRAGARTDRPSPLRRRAFVQHLPGPAYVVLCRSRVADRKPQDVTPVELRVRDEDLTRRVDAGLQLLVLLVRAGPAED